MSEGGAAKNPPHQAILSPSHSDLNPTGITSSQFVQKTRTPEAEAGNLPETPDMGNQQSGDGSLKKKHTKKRKHGKKNEDRESSVADDSVFEDTDSVFMVAESPGNSPAAQRSQATSYDSELPELSETTEFSRETKTFKSHTGGETQQGVPPHVNKSQTLQELSPLGLTETDDVDATNATSKQNEATSVLPVSETESAAKLPKKPRESALARSTLDTSDEGSYSSAGCSTPSIIASPCAKRSNSPCADRVNELGKEIERTIMERFPAEEYVIGHNVEDSSYKKLPESTGDPVEDHPDKADAHKESVKGGKMEQSSLKVESTAPSSIITKVEEPHNRGASLSEEGAAPRVEFERDKIQDEDKTNASTDDDFVIVNEDGESEEFAVSQRQNPDGVAASAASRQRSTEWCDVRSSAQKEVGPSSEVTAVFCEVSELASEESDPDARESGRSKENTESGGASEISNQAADTEESSVAAELSDVPDDRASTSDTDIGKGMDGENSGSCYDDAVLAVAADSAADEDINKIGDSPEAGPGEETVQEKLESTKTKECKVPPPSPSLMTSLNEVDEENSDVELNDTISKQAMEKLQSSITERLNSLTELHSSGEDSPVDQETQETTTPEELKTLCVSENDNDPELRQIYSGELAGPATESSVRTGNEKQSDSSSAKAVRRGADGISEPQDSTGADEGESEVILKLPSEEPVNAAESCKRTDVGSASETSGSTSIDLGNSGHAERAEGALPGNGVATESVGRPVGDKSGQKDGLEILQESRSRDPAGEIATLLGVGGTLPELAALQQIFENIQDRTPTTEDFPPFPREGAKSPAEPMSGSGRRSRTSPAITDKSITESDLDISEQRDDASTDSMYADDEDESATEVLFSKTYTEPEKGAEVLVSCTLVSNASNDADSDEFWAESSATEEVYRQVEESAEAARNVFDNARKQMQDIHVHLQNLRQQMEHLQESLDPPADGDYKNYSSLGVPDGQPVTD